MEGSVEIRFRLPLLLKRELDEYADEYDLSLASLMRMIVRDFLRSGRTQEALRP